MCKQAQADTYFLHIHAFTCLNLVHFKHTDLIFCASNTLNSGTERKDVPAIRSSASVFYSFGK